jgi:hypothetical protein
MKSIASMQAIHSAVLEYYYQFQLATQAQEKLNQIAYTAVITVLTTAVIAPSHVFEETLEELFLDPLIEATVSGITRAIGAELGIEDTKYAEIVASTIAETGRETVLGMGSTFDQQQQWRQQRYMKRILKTLGPEISQQIAQGEHSIISQEKSTEQERDDVSSTSVIMFSMALKSLSLPVLGIGAVASVGIIATSALSAYWANKIPMRDAFGALIGRFQVQQVIEEFTGDEASALTLMTANLLSAYPEVDEVHDETSSKYKDLLEFNYKDDSYAIPDTTKHNPTTKVISKLLNFEQMDGGKLLAYADEDMSVKELLGKIMLDKKPYVHRIGVKPAELTSQQRIRKGEVIIVDPETGRISVQPNQDACAGISKDILSKFAEIIREQLDHYSATGERLYNIEKAGIKAGIKTDVTARKYAKIILNDLFDPKVNSLTGQAVYNLIFGKASVSIHEVRRRCESANADLLTTASEWIDKIKERGGDSGNWDMKVEIRYRDCGHEAIKGIDRIAKQGCYDCMIEDFKGEELNHGNALDLAEARNLELISFNDDNTQLSESKFHKILNKFKEETKNIAKDKFGAKTYNIELRWKCKDCDHIFDNTYYNVRRSKASKYCPKCQSSIDQGITHKAAENAFYGYIKSADVDHSLRKAIPDEKILDRKEYKVISHGSVHVDSKFILDFGNGLEIVVIIEHQGHQHNTDPKIGYPAYKAMTRGRSKTDWKRSLARDVAKVKLFTELDNHYIIVVDHTVDSHKRTEYILNELYRQTGIKITPSGVTIDPKFTSSKNLRP